MTQGNGGRVISRDTLPLQRQAGPVSRIALGSVLKRGALWTAGSTVFLRLANIALMAVVARIVSPRELGIFTLAATVHAVIVSVAELGVASAIARSDLDLDRIAPTVATVSIVGSLFMAAPIAIFADDIAQMLDSSDAAAALRIMAIGVALIGPFAVPGALLQREFRQKVIFWASAIAFVPGSATLLILALMGDGPEAFAWCRVVGQLVMGLIMMSATGRPIWPGLRFDILRPLLAYGLPLAGANLLSQVLLNADYLFIGKLVSVSELGIYFLAFSIAMWPSAVIGSMLNALVLPAISLVQRDSGDVSQSVTIGLRTVALLAFPLAAFLAAFSLPLVALIYGPKWSAASPVLSTLAVYGGLSVVGLYLAGVIVAAGRTGILLIVQACALIALMPALPLGIVIAGIEGAAVAHIIVIAAVTTPVYMIAVRRATGLTVSALLKIVSFPAISAAVTGLVAWLATSLLENALFKVCGGAVIGLCLYGLLNRRAIADLAPAKVASLLHKIGRPFQFPTKGTRHPR